jgi:uncharacterized membrane protein HdeD (DUF308 family)
VSPGFLVLNAAIVLIGVLTLAYGVFAITNPAKVVQPEKGPRRRFAIRRTRATSGPEFPRFIGVLAVLWGIMLLVFTALGLFTPLP